MKKEETRMEIRSIEEMIRKYETQDPPIVDRQHRFYRCPECGRKITYKYNHCHRCGKAITWDGIRKEAYSSGKKTKAGSSKS